MGVPDQGGMPVAVIGGASDDYRKFFAPMHGDSAWRLHVLLVPSSGPGHSEPSVGATCGCWPQSPFRASPTPLVPEG